MKINHVLKKAEYYKDLTDYEKDVLKTFEDLTHKIGRPYAYYYCDHTMGDGGWCIVKKDGVWASYIDERGRFHGYEEFDDVYDLVLELINNMPLDSSVYCIDNLPKQEEFKEKYKQK